VIETPVFMPVGTRATVTGLTPDDLLALDIPIVLANTYHLLLRPGPEVFRRVGGIHAFMRWPRAVLTDSGGYQIFSLPAERTLTENGARFRSYVDGRIHHLTPEGSIEMQTAIGSDIMMVLDECVSATVDESVVQAAMHRTHRWALRSLSARADPAQALFAIVQGGLVPALRRQSAQFLTDHPFDGFAIGGLAVGDTRAQREDMTAFAASLLPIASPRYLMGVGTPPDLLHAIGCGIDMFDCVIPTHLAWQGTAFTSTGRVRIRRAELARRATGRALQLLDLPDVHAQLSASPVQVQRAAGAAPAQHSQPPLLPAADARGPGGDRRRPLRRLRARATGADRSSRARRGARVSHEVVRTRGGALAMRSLADGEVMHPGVGPRIEAEQLYVRQSRLEERLRAADDATLVVLDVGLGAGSNALAARAASERAAPGSARLELFSFERDLGGFELAIASGEAFGWQGEPGQAARALLACGEHQTARTRWRLVGGDLLDALARWTVPADIVFWDPFSPRANPALWTVAAFAATRRIAGPRCTLFTYSASTAIRLAMLLGGWAVGIGDAVGDKRQTTAAAVSGDDLARPLERGWLARLSRPDVPLPSDAPADAVARASAAPQFNRSSR
jgi:queuine tRNA-ribosyltransferase